MSKFTKGPWQVVGKTIVQNAEGETIALCNFADPNRRDEVDADNANAQLIASAPEMYAALVEKDKRIFDLEVRLQFLLDDSECELYRKQAKEALMVSK